MSVINIEDAKSLACQRVNWLAQKAGDEFEILLDLTKEVKQGWLFFFNTADFVKTKNSMHALAGNGPILVTHQGEIYQLPSAIPWENYLEEILADK